MTTKQKCVARCIINDPEKVDYLLDRIGGDRGIALWALIKQAQSKSHLYLTQEEMMEVGNYLIEFLREQENAIFAEFCHGIMDRVSKGRGAPL